MIKNVFHCKLVLFHDRTAFRPLPVFLRVPALFAPQRLFLTFYENFKKIKTEIFHKCQKLNLQKNCQKPKIILLKSLIFLPFRGFPYSANDHRNLKLLENQKSCFQKWKVGKIDFWSWHLGVKKCTKKIQKSSY